MSIRENELLRLRPRVSQNPRCQRCELKRDKGRDSVANVAVHVINIPREAIVCREAVEDPHLPDRA